MIPAPFGVIRLMAVLGDDPAPADPRTGLKSKIKTKAGKNYLIHDTFTTFVADICEYHRVYCGAHQQLLQCKHKTIKTSLIT